MQRPTFQIRALTDGSGYVIDAIWPEETEHLPGIHNSREDAERWLSERSEAYATDSVVARKA